MTPLLIVYSQLRCLGVEVDCRLKWDSHVAELIKSFAQKLIFLGNCISHQLMPELIFISRLFYPLSLMASLCGVMWKNTF